MEYRRPTGLKRICFDLIHPISLLWDLGYTDLTEREINRWYALRVREKRK